MTVSSLKKNTALLSGIFLPFILILLIWGTQKITETTVPAPLYSLLYVDREHNGNSDRIDVRIENGRIKASLNLLGSNKQQKEAFLVHINTATGEKKTARLVVPANIDPHNITDIAIPEPFASIKIHEGEISPDGYYADPSSNRSGGGLFQEIFGRKRIRNIILSKNGRSIPLNVGGNYWQPIQILGWVKP